MLSGLSKSAPDDQILKRIAAALGISDEAFLSQPKQLTFHTDVGGDRWFLTTSASGQPTVCCLSTRSPIPISTEESVAAFLAESLDQPQGKALAGLIEHVLSMHIHLDMRG